MIDIIPGAVVGRDKLWRKWTDEREVEVMAMAKGYAMIRRSGGCVPYVRRVREIYFPTPNNKLAD